MTIKSRGYRGETAGLLLTRWPTHLLLMRGKERDSHDWERLQYHVQASASMVSLVLRFDDTSDPSDYRAPTDADMQAILEFVRSTSETDRLLVLCPGGFGRSAAAAMLARAVQGMAPKQALDATLEDVPRATPNRLMLARADPLLHLDGELLSTYAEWARLALGLDYEPPVPLRPGTRRRPALRRRR